MSSQISYFLVKLDVLLQVGFLKLQVVFGFHTLTREGHPKRLSKPRVFESNQLGKVTLTCT